MIDLYAILGLKRDADDKQIHRAYRTLSKRHHPDMPGGDAATFDSLRTAHDVLADPDRRKRYDETGTYEATSPDNRDAQVAGVIAGLLEQALFGQDDPLKHDVLSRMRVTLDKIIAEQNQRQRQMLQAKARALLMADRFSTTAEHNRLADLLRGAEQTLTQNIAKVSEIIELNEAALKALAAYGYRFDKPSPQSSLYQVQGPYQGFGLFGFGI